MPTMDEINYMVEAAKLGVRFIGIQESFLGAATPLFVDVLETRTTFGLRPGETVKDALQRARDRFKHQDPPGTEAASPCA